LPGVKSAPFALNPVDGVPHWANEAAIRVQPAESADLLDQTALNWNQLSADNLIYFR
jgi:hypothetical protein